MRRGPLDLLFVVALVAVAGWLYHGSSSSSGKPAGPGLNFTLQEVSGASRSLSEVSGPVFIYLTATGCADCLARVHRVDRESVDLAKKNGLTVWNLLVYADNTAGAAFVADYAPSADAIFSDPGGSIGVNLLGGSDATCYLLLDENHNKVWQGGASPQELAQAIARMKGEAASGVTTTGANPGLPAEGGQVVH